MGEELEYRKTPSILFNVEAKPSSKKKKSIVNSCLGTTMVKWSESQTPIHSYVTAVGSSLVGNLESYIGGSHSG